MREELLWMLLIISCLASQAQSATDGAENTVMLPPEIVEQPASIIFREYVNDIVMKCKASGWPQPRYYWKKQALDEKDEWKDIEENAPGVRWATDGSGTFTIESARKSSSGRYQCFAENDHGGTMSKIAEIRAARFGTPDSHIQDYTGVEREYKKLNYDSLQSFPVSKKWWGYSKEPQSSDMRKLVENNRIFVDDEGNLHFANLILSDDSKNGKIYKCDEKNKKLDTTKGGSYSRLTVNPAQRDKVPLEFRYKTPDTVAFTGDKEVRLKCFYSGYPTPGDLNWERADGKAWPARVYKNKEKHTLLLEQLTVDHEGVYRCYPSGNKDMAQSIRLTVDAMPKLVTDGETQRPMPKNLTQGGNHTFICDGEGKPPIQREWFINNKIAQPRNGLEISADKKYLTVKDVQKVREADKSSDLMGIQCVISNKHGKDIGGAYLNVLLPTKIKPTGRPQNMTLVYKEPILYNCETESDPSTPVTVTWYWNGRAINLADPAISKLPNNTLKIVTKNKEKYGAEFVEGGGDFRCEASNGYSTDSATAYLGIPAGPPPAPAKLAILNYWWVFVLVAAILLLLLVTMCLCMYLRRNKGESYPVDKIERKDGNDPEQEVIDTGFHTYHRPDDDLNKSQMSLNTMLDGTMRKGSKDNTLRKASKASFASNLRTDSEDNSSLADYLEPGRFNEDGSFIGIYADQASQGSLARNQIRHPYYTNSRTALLEE